MNSGNGRESYLTSAGLNAHFGGVARCPRASEVPRELLDKGEGLLAGILLQ